MFKSTLSLMSSLSIANEVNIYTSRHYDSDDQLYEDFRKETGIKINVISGNGSALLERLKSGCKLSCTVTQFMENSKRRLF